MKTITTGLPPPEIASEKFDIQIVQLTINEAAVTSGVMRLLVATMHGGTKHPMDQ